MPSTAPDAPPGPARAVPDGLSAGGRFTDWHGRAPSYVAVDVDGTLVGPEALPTAAVREALAALEARGVKVGVATGRMAPSLAPLLAAVRLSGPHVFHNGAQVLDGGLTRTLALDGIDDAAVDRLLAVAAARDDLTIEFYTETGWFSSTLDPRARAHWDLLGGLPYGPLTGADGLDGPAIKATFVLFDPNAREGIVALARELGLEPGPAGSPRTPELVYVNVTRPEVDKGAGVRTVAAALGLALDAVAAIGDEENDLGVLGSVGTAIAMGQAESAVRAVAHLVAPPVAEDGAATALAALAALVDAARAAEAPQRPPGTE